MSNIKGALVTSKLEPPAKPAKRFGSTVVISCPGAKRQEEHSNRLHQSDRFLVDRGMVHERGLHEARLVTVDEQSQDSEERDSTEEFAIQCEKQGTSSTQSDEGVISPTSIDYEDEEDNIDGYYEDYEAGYGQAEHIDELTDLSRESMMPLHELIAYFQCINDNQPISRQSSCTSRDTTKSKHSPTADSVDGISMHEKHGAVLTEKAKAIIEPPTIKVVISEQLSAEQSNSPESGETEGNTEELEQQAAKAEPPPVKDKRKVRSNVIRELINSERDFVKHLKDVVEGYLFPARRHPEIFTVLRIKTIFANIEQLYEFQQKFLAHLETCINWDDLASSQVGHCFLEHEHEFSVYHYYCNNHPNASSELADLLTKPRFVKFFEACSIVLKEQNMINQAIDSLLLTPVQKICRYSLQLNELLKNTEESHPDFRPVIDALESMRNCANLANERRRRIEALANVMSFQEKFDNWVGPKLSETSSILIHSGEVVKENSHTWPSSAQLYLFDHLLLYCKKDLLKRNNLILKGRVSMETVREISDADEYKPKKSFKLFCEEQQKWFVFTTGSEKEKDEWMKAFDRERNLVEADEKEGFQITEKEISVAKLELQKRKHHQHSRSTRLRHKRPDTAVVDQLDLNDVTTIMNRTLSLPSCIHPNHVMNFVEDSRVVSGSKKKTPENRSPMNSSLILSDQENNQQQSTGWFRKMGSKKLAKSQIYTVNGSASSSNNKNQSVSPSFLSEASVTKYNQLEKRHRDHMVCEEQARLLRLNNDTPPSGYTMKSHSRLVQANRDFVQPTTSPNVVQSSNTGHHREEKTFASYRTETPNMDPGAQSDSTRLSSNERTVMLSTGRIVRVREDEV